MKSITRILFPTDFSTTAQNAMRYALWIADRYEATIDVLHVVYPEHVQMDLPAYSAQATAEKVESAKEVMKIFVENALIQAQAAFEMQHTPDIHSDVHVGGVINAIIQSARQHGSDMIIMGTAGEHSTLQRLFGGVTTAAIRKVSSDIMVIPEEATPGHIDHVGYATDLTEDDPLHIWECIRLFAPFKPSFHVVHVKTPEEESRPVRMSELKQFFEDHDPSVHITFHEVKGVDVDDELSAFVEEHDLDFLVMHTHKRNIFERLGHASHTRMMTRYSSVPLLVMK